MRWLALLLATSCATTVSQPVQISARDGERATFIECTRSPANCHAAARTYCNGDYLPIAENRRAIVLGDVYGVDTVHRFELTFRCK